jgi:hypothetical protein
VDTTEFDRQIEALEERTNALRVELDRLARRLFAPTADFVTTWYRAHVEQALLNNPEAVKSAGPRLSAMKADVSDLLSRVPQVVEQFLDVDEAWPHRGEIKVEDLQAFPPLGFSQPPHRLEAQIRAILGVLGEILVKHGFARLGRASEWAKRPTGAYTDVMIFAHRVEWTKNMKDAIADYSQRLHDLAQAERQLAGVKRDKEAAEIRHLWEQA